jgi:hypothetical protein
MKQYVEKKHMKFNWKILVAVVLMVGIVYWAFDSNRTRSYNGTNLTFAAGSGPITLTNPSEMSIPVQLSGTGSRSFSIVSNIEGLNGSSTREGTGSSAVQTFAFDLAPGITELTVLRGSGVNFAAETATLLEAVVQPVNASQAGSNTVLAAVIVAALLFFISYTTEHQWMGMLRRTPAPIPVPVVEGSAGGQGKSAKSYGDNRA